VLERLIYPVLGGYTFDHHAAEHLLETHFFTSHGFQEVALVSVIGVAIFGVGWKKNLLFKEIPRVYGPDYWYERLASTLIWMAKGPFQTLDSVIDKGYLGTSKSFLKLTKTAVGIDEKIDHKYVEVGEKFMETAKPALVLEEKIEDAYVETGEKILDSLGGQAEVAQEGSFKYLKEPLTVFDQSAEEFFEGLATDVIRAVKYPYAVAIFIFDLIIDRKDKRNIKVRAEDFEEEMQKLIEVTPNISGISVAIFIIVGMLAIYLLTATMT
jgi:hypothetical protein